MSYADKVWTVADVMIEDVIKVSPSTPFKQLVDLLWVNDASALPVVDERGVLAGIVTESDLLARAEFKATARHATNHKNALYEKLDTASPLVASDLMTKSVVTVRPEATLAETARMMRAKQLRRLPVVDSAGALVGMVSQSDLLKVFFRSEETLELDVRDVLKRHLGRSDSVKVRVVDGVVHLEGLASGAPETKRVVATLDAMPGVVGVELK